jgi:hypothetical protein
MVDVLVFFLPRSCAYAKDSCPHHQLHNAILTYPSLNLKERRMLICSHIIGRMEDLNFYASADFYTIKVWHKSKGVKRI